MKKLMIVLSGLMAVALTSCGHCDCNKTNPALLKDYKPTSAKSF